MLQINAQRRNTLCHSVVPGQVKTVLVGNCGRNLQNNENREICAAVGKSGPKYSNFNSKYSISIQIIALPIQNIKAFLTVKDINKRIPIGKILPKKLKILKKKLKLCPYL